MFCAIISLPLFYYHGDQMQIRLEVGARTAPTILIPFVVEVVDFDDEGVVLSLGGESEVRIEFYDWETGLASIGYWGGEEYVVQSGGQSLVDASPEKPRTSTRPSSPVQSPSHRRVHSSPVKGEVKPSFVFFRAARLENTQSLIASFNEEEEVEYDNRLGLRFKASSESKILWTVSDPFAGLDLSTATTRDDDLEQHMAEVIFQGNGKYYVVQGLGEDEDENYGIRVSEAMFAPEELNQRCKACEEASDD